MCARFGGGLHTLQSGPPWKQCVITETPHPTPTTPPLPLTQFAKALVCRECRQAVWTLTNVCVSLLPSPAIAMLKDKEPGSFIVRDSHSFRGAYGLAMKVATPPPSVLQLNKKGRDAEARGEHSPAYGVYALSMPVRCW